MRGDGLSSRVSSGGGLSGGHGISGAAAGGIGYHEGMRSDEFEVVPEGWLSRGEAFVRGQGAQLIVHGGIPGEPVRVRVLSRTHHQVMARAIGPAGEPSPLRAAPPCDRYDACGRCPMMHLQPGALDQARVGIVEDALREAGLSARLESLGTAPALGGVHTMELVAGRSDQGRIRIGVAGSHGREVLPIPDCPVSTPGLRAGMKTLAHHCIRLDVHPFDGRGGTLRRARFLDVPRAPGPDGVADSRVLVVLSVQRRNAHMKELAESLCQDLREVEGVIIHNEVEDPEGEDLWVAAGRDHVEGSLAGLRLRVGARDPFPARPAMSAEAARAAVTLLSPQRGDAVLDIGSGNGLRTMLLAKKAGWALGVDPSAPAAARARENAALNHLSAEFTTGSTTDALQNPRLRDLRPLVYIDVERKGLDRDAFDALIGVAPRRVALEGTNPRALARDVARLQERGFALRSVTAWDTTPYTPFLSCVAMLASTDLSGPDRRAPQRRRIR